MGAGCCEGLPIGKQKNHSLKLSFVFAMIFISKIKSHIKVSYKTDISLAKEIWIKSSWETSQFGMMPHLSYARFQLSHFSKVSIQPEPHALFHELWAENELFLGELGVSVMFRRIFSTQVWRSAILHKNHIGGPFFLTPPELGRPTHCILREENSLWAQEPPQGQFPHLQPWYQAHQLALH